jgi:arylsulfatase A-like enzyme
MTGRIQRARRPDWSSLLILLLPALLAAGCDFFSRRPPSVVLISVDTLRADQLAAYGGPPDLAPRLQELAEEALIFERAVVPQPWTLTSHMSMLTSYYPLAHAVDRKTALSPEVATLAEILSSAGFATGAVTSNPGHLSPKYGFDRGFDSYQTDWWSAEEVSERALEWLDGRQQDRFFLLVHYFDPHSDWGRLPYEAPEPFRGRYADKEARIGERARFNSRDMVAMHEAGERLEPAERETLKRLYMEGVAYTDHQIGLFLEALRDRGLYEDSLIILTSDHGEELGEHGGLLHFQIYNETARAPLLLKPPRGWPDRSKARVPQTIRTVDLMPTILDLLQLPTPEGAQGRSLVPLISGGEEADRLAFTYGKVGEDTCDAVQDSRWKLILCRDGETRLYDLKDDPAEVNDLSEDRPGIAGRYRRLLVGWRREMAEVRREVKRTAPPTEIRQETEEQLRALGYVE